MLMKRGYERVRPLEGGLDAWQMTGRDYALYDAAGDEGERA
jgi:hypothetical protein